MKNSIVIRVCMGPAGIAAGGRAVLDEFRKTLTDKKIPAEISNRCTHHQVGCMGLCARDVLVDVIIKGHKTSYEFVKPDMVRKIVDQHIIGGEPVKQWLADGHMHKFLEKQVKVVLSDCGVIDPEDIEAYISRGGYSSCEKIFGNFSPEELIHEIKLSGLRGRGGAGFPTGLKWELARKSEGNTKYIICNADEGDPGAFMDRAVIEGNPHSVIEGMITGAYATGAQKGYVYIRAEYPLAVERIKQAITQAREKNYLGKNIFGSSFNFDIEIKLGAGAFVCGEETALIASIEGQRGMPRAKPPFPVHKGLWGKPTVINNAETLANIPHIIRNGAAWFSGLGTEDSKGTKVFALTGKIKNSGLIEVPMGITLREIIHDIGGGLEPGKHLKAVQTGGPSGGCIPAEMLDIKVDYESLAKAGCIVGSGGMIVLDNDDCMVNIAKYFLNFTQSESCGKCVPCRIGTKRMLEMLERITNGLGQPGDIEKLEQLSADIKSGSLCGLGQTAPNPVLSTIKYFRDEYEAHIFDKKCPAGVCNSLLTFTIIEDRCKGCQACAKACPSKAITGEKKKPHAIDQSLCIKCGACFEVCKFRSVEKA
ncbi:MAG: NADH-quinone oxidoreductase subunit NuoF [Nitrospiraceae bacterium]|nr:NADH-quinone oxidoreductase subunit NuoF [Nitrospiraceae bacterium]